MLLGGRAAEEEVFDEAYSGAADDLARVHEICVQMVTEFGMTIAKGPPDSAPLALPIGDYALSDRPGATSTPAPRSSPTWPTPAPAS